MDMSRAPTVLCSCGPYCGVLGIKVQNSDGPGDFIHFLRFFWMNLNIRMCRDLVGTSLEIPTMWITFQAMSNI